MRKVVHVRPSGSGWAVIRAEAVAPVSTHAGQTEALYVARMLVQNEEGMLVIHNADDTVRNSEVYGRSKQE